MLDLGGGSLNLQRLCELPSIVAFGSVLALTTTKQLYSEAIASSSSLQHASTLLRSSLVQHASDASEGCVDHH